MAFKLKVPNNPRIEMYMRAASTAYPIDSLVAADGDNSTQAFVVATASTVQHLGVLQRAVAATDSNYATATKEPVLVDEDGIWEVDVLAGTPTANYEMYKCDLSTNLGLNTGAASVKAFAITNFVSATKLHGKLTTWFGRNAS
jgi:hypothetical protein